MNRPNPSDDEFDIEILAQKTYSVFRKTLRKLLFPVRVLIARPLRLLVFVSCGILLATILFYTLPKRYVSDFIIKPSNKGDLYFVDLIMDLGQLVYNKDHAALSQQLNLDEHTCSKLSRISVELIRKSKGADTADAAIIYILSSDYTIFDTVQNSILRYLENDPYYGKMKKLRELDIADMQVKIAKNMEEIENLKKVVTQNMEPRASGGFVYGEPLNPVTVYEADLSLFRQQLGLRWQSNYASNFGLIKKCLTTTRPSWPKLPVLIIICVGVSLLVCFIFNYRNL